MLEWSTIFHVYKSPTHPLPSLELGYDCFRCMDHVDRRSLLCVSQAGLLRDTKQLLANAVKPIDD